MASPSPSPSPPTFAVADLPFSNWGTDLPFGTKTTHPCGVVSFTCVDNLGNASPVHVWCVDKNLWPRAKIFYESQRCSNFKFTPMSAPDAWRRKYPDAAPSKNTPLIWTHSPTSRPMSLVALPAFPHPLALVAPNRIPRTHLPLSHPAPRPPTRPPRPPRPLPQPILMPPPPLYKLFSFKINNNNNSSTKRCVLSWRKCVASPPSLRPLLRLLR
jgi:hypothetical protein